ncbi:acyltransferase family protein [Paraburkholderia strydomiana]|uniref:acyltransferase family protein n=1 Tax=Paraburkholderia strydomiana TaxID=1245417 RepID=UPI001BE7712D|nr:acyltransferase [Paraburkholderia strydomiana]
MFFVISGFLIGSNLIRTLANNDQTPSFRSFVVPFYIRRVWRIWPSAWLWLLVPILLSLYFNRSGVLLTPLGNVNDAASGVMQIANFHFWRCAAIRDSACGVSGVYWSLSIEEQFYIFFPLLLFFANRRVVVLVLVLTIVVQMFIPRPVVSFPWYVRTDALAVGVLLAIWNNHRPIQPTKSAFLGRNAYFILIALSIGVTAIPHVTGNRFFAVSAIALTSGMVVLVALYLENGHTGKCVSRVFRYLGSRSYSIYLIHVLAYFVTREVWLRITGGSVPLDSHFTLRFAITAALLTFGLAEISYRSIETPLRLYGVRAAKRWSQPQPRPPQRPARQI